MKIALAQICTERDLDANLAQVAARVREAAEQGARLVVFPEATMRAFGHNLTSIAQPLDGPWASRVRELAAEHDITIVAGTFIPGADDQHVRNVLLATGRGVEEAYTKLHLYDAFGFKESDTVTPGDDLVQIEVDGVRIGLAICYDVRFPQLFIQHARNGAQAVILSASWQSGPGKAEQFDLLVRARALDSTSFLLVCGQADPKQSGVDAKESAPTGIGHSQVVSPTGEVLAKAGESPELLVFDLDVSKIEKVRQNLPVLENARLS